MQEYFFNSIHIKIVLPQAAQLSIFLKKSDVLCLPKKYVQGHTTVLRDRERNRKRGLKIPAPNKIRTQNLLICCCTIQLLSKRQVHSIARIFLQSNKRG